MDDAPHTGIVSVMDMDADDTLAPEQLTLVRALETDPRIGWGACARRIDTHISHIFLFPDVAIKLKRALRLPFVDQSDAAARRRLSARELELNRAFAPALYLGTAEMGRDANGRWRIREVGAGEECVLVMRRFAEGDLLDEAARAGRLTTAQCARLGARIAHMHRNLAPHPEMGHAADYRRVIEELAETERAAAAALGLSSASEDLFAALDGALIRVSGLIEQRRREGAVRRGHGDLHLRNICFWQGEPTPFDALEFDERLATTDVVYDVAFTLMDLRRYGLRAHANALMNAYWDAAGEGEEALALLPLFMALRAAVLVAVRVQAGDLVEADVYRRLAHDLLDMRHKRRLALVGGLSGSGKSALAQALAPRLGGPCGARVLRTDMLRGEGADDYTDAGRAAVYARLFAHARSALEAGADVIADATFERAAWRDGAGDVQRDFVGLWLDAAPDVRARRVAGRRDDPSKATPEIALQQSATAPEGVGWIVLDASRDADAVLADAAARLGLT